MRHLSQVPPGPIFPGQYASLYYLNTYICTAVYNIHTHDRVRTCRFFLVWLSAHWPEWITERPYYRGIIPCQKGDSHQLVLVWKAPSSPPEGHSRSRPAGCCICGNSLPPKIRDGGGGMAEYQPWSTKPLLNTEEACQHVSSPLTLSLWNILVVKWIAWHGSGACALRNWDHWSRQSIDFGSEGKEDLSSSCSAIPSCRVSWLLTPLHPRGPAGWGVLVRVSQ